MKRFHVHLHVDDLNRSIGFYSQLFAAQPARVESDYAKWMLEDPPVNFAISTRGNKPGIDHLGIQTDDAEELAVLKARAEAADMTLLDTEARLPVNPDKFLSKSRNTPFAGRRLRGWPVATILGGNVVWRRERR